jgi:hypothetical protein
MRPAFAKTDLKTNKTESTQYRVQLDAFAIVVAMWVKVHSQSVPVLRTTLLKTTMRTKSNHFTAIARRSLVIAIHA